MAAATKRDALLAGRVFLRRDKLPSLVVENPNRTHDDIRPARTNANGDFRRGGPVIHASFSVQQSVAVGYEAARGACSATYSLDGAGFSAAGAARKMNNTRTRSGDGSAAFLASRVGAGGAPGTAPSATELSPLRSTPTAGASVRSSCAFRADGTGDGDAGDCDGDADGSESVNFEISGRKRTATPVRTSISSDWDSCNSSILSAAPAASPGAALASGWVNPPRRPPRRPLWPRPAPCGWPPAKLPFAAAPSAG